MTRHRLTRWITALLLVAASQPGVQAQGAEAIAHAKQVVDRLNAEQFEDVVKEFNAPMTAALPAAQLRAVWSTMRQQVGPFKAFIDERVTTPAPGSISVVLGTQFERAALDVIVAFDASSKIAGLRFVPRQAPIAAPAPPPPASTFREEGVTVGTGEWALPGTLSLPVGRATAAVVLVHGSGPGDRDQTVGPNKPFRDLAWGLANRGIAVLRYEKRTRVHGARMAGNRTGTVREEALDDAHLAVALLRARPEIDPKRIFVLGLSLGGTLAPRIAAADPSLAGIVIMAGATRPLLDVAREQFAYLASIAPGSPGPEQGLQALRNAAPESYWKDLDSYDPAAVAASLSMPILILQGERDYQVSMADFAGWRDALEGKSNVTLKSYPALNHLFMTGTGKSTPSEYLQPGNVAPGVVVDIADWIGKV